MYTTLTMPLIHREGLLKLINDGIRDIPATWKKIAPNVIRSRQAYEEIQTHAGLGFFAPMDEAEGVTYDEVQPRFSKRYTPIIRTLGIKYTEQSAYKDLNGFVKAQGPLLAQSAVATLNLLACNVLNLGFGGGSAAPDVAGPGTPNLFSSAHPLADGTTDTNLLTQALSGLSLENAIQVAMAHKGDRGIPRYYRGGFKLVVGPTLAGLATRAVDSVGLQGTADNDTNKFVNGAISEIVVDQLVGFSNAALANNWFLIPSDAQDNPIFYMEVQGVKTATDYDIDFMAHKFVSSFESLFDVFGWRGMVGSQL